MPLKLHDISKDLGRPLRSNNNMLFVYDIDSGSFFASHTLKGIRELVSKDENIQLPVNAFNSLFRKMKTDGSSHIFSQLNNLILEFHYIDDEFCIVSGSNTYHHWHGSCPDASTAADTYASITRNKCAVI